MVADPEDGAAARQVTISGSVTATTLLSLTARLYAVPRRRRTQDRSSGSSGRRPVEGRRYRRALAESPSRSRSGLGAVVEVHHAATERALVLQLELDADALGKSPLPPAHQNGHHEQVKLVDEPGSDGLRGEVRSADADVALRRRL